MTIRILALALIVFSVVATRAHALDVTGCPLIVTHGETATLQADVDCRFASPEYNAYGIVLGQNARLELNGHTLRQVGFDLLTSVYCLGKCEVVGPGRITTTDVGGGIMSFRRGQVTVSHLTIDNLVSGISVPFGRAIVSDVDIQARLYGIEARNLTVADVDITLAPSPDSLSRCVATAGGWVKGADLTVSGCDIGIEAKRDVVLTRFNSAGGEIGILSQGRVTLVDSSVTGATYPPNGLDIFSKKLPRLTNTVCDHSGRFERSWPGTPAVPWGVCSGD
jgi:hypothetical protein